MILYTNGCSWTWGGGLHDLFKRKDGTIDDEYRLKLLWPGHLSRLIKADKVVNLAAACGSNQRIVRTTIDWISKQNKSDLENTVAVIQFSEWNRFEKYIPLSNNYFENDKHRWLRCRIDSALFEYEGPTTHSEDDENFIQREIKYINRRLMTTNLVENYYDILQQLYALKGIFTTYGVKNYYFWHLGQGWLSFPPNARGLIYKDFDILDQINGAYNWSDFDEKHEDYWQYERLVPNQHVHPSLEGHKQLAQIIYDRMKRKGYNR